MSYLTEFSKLVGRRRQAPCFEGVDVEFVQQFRKTRARGRPMSVADWTETMRRALAFNDPLTAEAGHKYNKFDLAAVSEALADEPDILVAPAREFSPAIYVSGPSTALDRVLRKAKSLRASEAAILEDGTLRLWWD